jgi:hypothetical protein
MKNIKGILKQLDDLGIAPSLKINSENKYKTYIWRFIIFNLAIWNSRFYNTLLRYTN